MTLKPATLVLAFSFIGCSGDEKNEPIHVTCDELDSRGITNRINGLVSDNPEILDLDGHCLEASINILSGDAWLARFEPKTELDEVATYHIEIYFKHESTRSDTYLQGHEPSGDAVISPQCPDVPLGYFCGHIDQNEADPEEDNVDYRIVSGSIDLTVEDTTSLGHTVAGPLEWAFATIDRSKRPFKTNGVSVIVNGDLQLDIAD